MKQIVSSNNALIKKICKLHKRKYRDQEGKFLIEELHLLQEAHVAQLLDILFVREGEAVPFDFENTYFVSDEVLKRLSLNVSSVNYIGVANKANYAAQSYSRCIFLDNVQDPGNVGTIIRSAYSFGFDAVYLSKGCVDAYNEKCIRSTQGALFHIPIIECDIDSVVSEKINSGHQVYATCLQGAKPLSSYVFPSNNISFVFGNEGKGVSPSILSLCNQKVYIEMSAFESLNVAIAASICMYMTRL